MTEENKLVMRYVSGQAKLDDVEAEVSTLLRELTDPGSQAFQQAVAAGLDPAPLSRANITIEKEGKGFGPVAIMIAIYIPVAAHIINKFWDDVVWPRITGELGRDALGKREDKEDDE
jgi:hypothetical protein